jgi:hypothetical protein
MKTFVAVYRGKAIRTAKLVAVSVDPKVASLVATHMLRDVAEASEDRILDELEQGEARALRCIAEETSGGEDTALQSVPTSASEHP